MTTLNISLAPITIKKLDDIKSDMGLNRSAMLSVLISDRHAEWVKAAPATSRKQPPPATKESVIKAWKKKPKLLRTAATLANDAVAAGLHFTEAWSAVSIECQWTGGQQLTEDDVPDGMWEYRPRSLGGTYIKPKNGEAE